MKKIKFISVFILLVSAFILISCSTSEPVDPVLVNQLNANNTNNNNGGNNNGGTTTAVFKADFNGQTWTADAASANIYNGVIQIAGIKGSLGQGFGFSLNGTGAGTYASTSNLIAYNPPSSGDSYIASNPNNASSVEGSVIVTSIDTTNHTISGTFSFVGYWSDWSVTNVPPITFTGGVFTNIPYTSVNTNTDTFYTKVDGTEFVENTIDVSAVTSSGFPDSYSIVASKTNGDNVGLSIAQSLGVGTYALAGPFGTQVNSSCLFGGVLFNGETGSIIITSKTATHIEGTFNIIVKNQTTLVTKTLSQGAFSVDLL